MTTTCAFEGMDTAGVRPGSELQRGNAGDDRRRAGHASPPDAFFQDERSNQRREQYRYFTQRRNDGDGRLGHRPQHDAVGRETRRAANETPSPSKPDIAT